MLSSSRRIGFSMGGIPYTEVTSWLDENRIVQFEERERFRRFINLIDGVYVEEKTPKTDKKNKKG